MMCLKSVTAGHLGIKHFITVYLITKLWIEYNNKIPKHLFSFVCVPSHTSLTYARQSSGLVTGKMIITNVSSGHP